MDWWGISSDDVSVPHRGVGGGEPGEGGLFISAETAAPTTQSDKCQKTDEWMDGYY